MPGDLLDLKDVQLPRQFLTEGITESDYDVIIQFIMTHRSTKLQLAFVYYFLFRCTWKVRGMKNGNEKSLNKT